MYLEEQDRNRFQEAARAARQERYDQHHGHRNNVLEDQYPEDNAAMRSPELVFLLQQPQDNGGAAERNQEPDQDGGIQGKPEEQRNQE